MSSRSVGVEEELLLVDPETGQPRAVAETVLAAAQQAAADDRDGDGAALEFELKQQQLETNSEPCRTLGELHREIRRGRAGRRGRGRASRGPGRGAGHLAGSGRTEGRRHEPLPAHGRRFGLTAHEQLTCGCHVHVGISSDEEGVAVLDRIGPWLSVLLALSANSPFWPGQDSSYASFRYQAWGRWPGSGPAGPFRTAQSYHEKVRQMVQTGTLLDEGMVYFDARLSGHYQTIEIRVADVCLRADDTVRIASLARALVETEARAAREGKAASRMRIELLRLAAWRASRSSLDGVLLSPVTGLPERAAASRRPAAGPLPRRSGGRGRRGHRDGAAGRTARAGQRRGLPAGRVPPVRQPA